MRASERIQKVSETIKLRNRAKRYGWIHRFSLGGFAAAGAILLLTSATTAEANAEFSAAPERTMKDMLLIPASSEAAGSAATQSGLYRTLPKQGDSIAIRYAAPLFSEPVRATSDPRALHVTYFGQPGEKMTVKTLSGEMLSFHTYDKGTLWIPLWYVSEASANTVSLAPQYVTLSPEAKLSLAPSSSVKWAQDKVVEASQMVAMAKWNDWYGVIVTPPVWHEGYEVYRPTLLWVRDKDVTGVTPVPTPLLGPDSLASLDTIRGITELSLKLGDDKKTVEKLLGAPMFTETSDDLQTVVGDPMILGEAWRYERKDAHFTVTFSPSGKLVRTHWIIPAEGEPPWNRLYSGDDYLFSQDYYVTPLPQTLDIKPKWRNQGTLGFTYLLGAGKDTLLIKGDDGGFSGMHYASSLYAVGRSDGETRWQVDAGFGVLSAAMESSGDYAFVYTSYNPAEQKYVNQVRRIRMSDGKTMWERNSGDENQMGMWAAKKSVILVTWKDTGQEDASVPSVLSVLDSETGKERWQRNVAGETQILNQGAEDPYVLIRDNNKLEALDLMTGEPAWQIKVKADGGLLEDPGFEPYFAGGPQIDPFTGPDSDKRWILAGDAWQLLELKTGTSTGEYKASPGERFEVLNERYLLVQHPLDNSDYWSATQFETRLYDVAAEKTKLTIPGKGSKGAIKDETLYLVVDGIPAAIDMKTGIYLWRMLNTAAEYVDLSRYTAGSFAVLDHAVLFPYGSDLLILGKHDGSVLGRLRDVRTGYAELRELDHRNGTLNRHGDELYVGTANGGFFKYDVGVFTAVVQ
ncbi:PQQ-binding-like beta-propeller repeat protein [Fontibacillus sp. BL9]|uniref:outer membrane protein assembly factor BamB family protein n=1 Tax=Fontibacillus sp. BL9 TaxID=3389971 RepID=UPI0039786FB3